MAGLQGVALDLVCLAGDLGIAGSAWSSPALRCPGGHPSASLPVGLTAESFRSQPNSQGQVNATDAGQRPVRANELTPADGRCR